MGDLTANLSRREFACKCPDANCSGKHVADFGLVKLIQAAADHFSDLYCCRVSVAITSGNRCKAYNSSPRLVELGAAPRSRHTKYDAADWRISLWIGGGWMPLTPKELAKWLDERLGETGGLKVYSNRVHTDMRKLKWRSGV